MKKNTLLLVSLSLFFTLFAIGQNIGINTENPVSLFHIDALGNNPSINTESSNTFNDDLVLRVNNHGESNLIIGGNTLSSVGEASLELNADNKALALNNVLLTSVLDVVTVPNPSEGMMVFNKSYNGIAPHQVIPGIYIFKGLQWELIRTIEQQESLQTSISDLAVTVNSGALTSVANVDSGKGASTLSFYRSNLQSDNAVMTYIEVPEEGRYLFSLKLYGKPSGATSRNYTYGEYYLYLFKRNSDESEVLLNKVRMIIMDKGNTFFTYTPTVMTPLLNKNDQIRIKVGYVSTIPSSYPWQLVAATNTSKGKVANRTSLAFWKIR